MARAIAAIYPRSPARRQGVGQRTVHRHPGDRGSVRVTGWRRPGHRIATAGASSPGMLRECTAPRRSSPGAICAPASSARAPGGEIFALLAIRGMNEPPAILLVEDDVPTRTFLTGNLSADGYDVRVAGTLRDAVRTLEYHDVDLAVIDLGLPDGSGFELLTRVRESGGPGSRIDARVPLIVLS